MSMNYCVGWHAYYICGGMIDSIDFSTYTQDGLNEFMRGWNDAKQESK